jgi:hypothetical protein
MTLRTEKDWEQSIEPVAVSEDGNVSTFALEADQPFLYFKPCLVESAATCCTCAFPWLITARLPGVSGCICPCSS